MARTKKTPAKTDGLFWSPEVGETITGKFLQWEVLTAGKFDKGPRLGMRLLVAAGEKLVSMSYVLMETFRPVKDKVKAGDKISLTFTEKKKIKGGHTVKEYSATWRGKPLERPSNLGAPATKAQVNDLFGAGNGAGKE